MSRRSFLFAFECIRATRFRLRGAARRNASTDIREACDHRYNAPHNDAGCGPPAKKMRILLVEDNRTLADWLVRTLQRDRYTIDCVYDGADADHLLCTQTYELVILDLALPRLDGREVLRRMRRRSAETPVLILTAYDSLEGRIDGLDAGADDFMAKPFEVRELEARIRALVRRGNQHRSPLLHCGQLS